MVKSTIIEQLQRLGAKPGDPSKFSAQWPPKLREILSWTFPQGVRFRTPEPDDDDTAELCGVDFSEAREIKEEGFPFLRGRPLYLYAMATGGNYLLVLPLDTKTLEDPLLYVLDGDQFEQEFSPEPLSAFLTRLQIDTEDEE